MVQLYKWCCPAFYQLVSTMPLMKQLLLFLTILVTGHLNITWYANVNGHLAVVLSHHWRLQYDDMHTNHIVGNHDFDLFLMRFCIQWLLQVWWKFWASRNGCCFVIHIRMEVHYAFDQEDLIVWILVLKSHILDHWILVSCKVATLANLQTQGAHQ